VSDGKVGSVPWNLTMRIEVLLFASHREILGSGHVVLNVPQGATVEDVFTALESREPLMKPLRRYTTFAVNRQMVDPSTRLSPGDEVALLQPVSGGIGD
jgi:molybdopterin converting factor small subunit